VTGDEEQRLVTVRQRPPGARLQTVCFQAEFLEHLRSSSFSRVDHLDEVRIDFSPVLVSRTRLDLGTL